MTACQYNNRPYPSCSPAFGHHQASSMSSVSAYKKTSAALRRLMNQLGVTTALGSLRWYWRSPRRTGGRLWSGLCDLREKVKERFFASLIGHGIVRLLEPDVGVMHARHACCMRRQPYLLKRWHGRTSILQELSRKGKIPFTA